MGFPSIVPKSNQAVHLHRNSIVFVNMVSTIMMLVLMRMMMMLVVMMMRMIMMLFMMTMRMMGAGFPQVCSVLE